jgi:cytidine deaminase
MLTAEERRELRGRAAIAAQHAYAPYSHFRVGAAVLGMNGIYTGVNVENGSLGLSLCAERSALSAAVGTGDRSIRAIAIACIDAPGTSCTPCGACRQWIEELAPKAEILIGDQEEVLAIGDLLPRPFTLKRA